MMLNICITRHFFLQDYVMRFGLWAENVTNQWHGGVANISLCPGEEVWGVVWSMSSEDGPSLDK